MQYIILRTIELSEVRGRHRPPRRHSSRLQPTTTDSPKFRFFADFYSHCLPLPTYNTCTSANDPRNRQKIVSCMSALSAAEDQM